MLTVRLKDKVEDVQLELEMRKSSRRRMKLQLRRRLSNPTNSLLLLLHFEDGSYNQR